MISELTMQGLPGTTGKVIAMHTGNVEQACAMVLKGKKYKAVSMAGPNGSANVWLANSGGWYGEYDVHRMPIEERSFGLDRQKAANWLRKAARKCL